MKRIKFGNLIRDYRTKKGWTQAELARELGYDSPQFISLLERDQSKAPLYVLGQLIVLLGIPEGEIVESLVTHYQEELRAQINKGKKLASARGA
jgi:transcriptional regulator with XRE-family HTH domain